jgi:GT2 family glycosyltransferase
MDASTGTIMSPPQVTVIICTYARADNLRKCLESLRAQDYPAMDVLVVYRPPENGNDDTEKIVAGFGAKLVRQDGKGIANARNLGVRAAVAEYIAFIDDDCTAAPDWLRKLMDKLLASGAAGVSGTALTGATGAVEFRNGTVDIYGRGRCRNAAPGEHYRPDGRIFNNVVCMNVAFRRADVMDVGGFDEYFNYFYEETDLAVRMIQAGHRIVHEPEAVVFHNSTDDMARQSRQLFNISRNTTYMPLKNFRERQFQRRLVLRWLCIRRMATFLVPLARREISVGTYRRYCRDIARGFRDAIRDAKTMPRPQTAMDRQSEYQGHK